MPEVQSTSEMQLVAHAVVDPLHRYVPHDEAGVRSRATGVQLPGLPPLHVPQAPHADDEQQTPLVQWLLLHALPPAHVAPFANFGMQWPPVQNDVASQSTSLAHEVRQLVVAQP